MRKKEAETWWFSDAISLNSTPFSGTNGGCWSNNCAVPLSARLFAAPFVGLIHCGESRIRVIDFFAPIWNSWNRVEQVFVKRFSSCLVNFSGELWIYRFRFFARISNLRELECWIRYVIMLIEINYNIYRYDISVRRYPYRLKHETVRFVELEILRQIHDNSVRIGRILYLVSISNLPNESTNESMSKKKKKKRTR